MSSLCLNSFHTRSCILCHRLNGKQYGFSSHQRVLIKAGRQVVYSGTTSCTNRTMNMENVDLDKPLNSVIPFTRFEHALVGGLYMLFCVTGVITNLLTAFTFYKDTRLVTSSKPWLHIALALANVGVVGPSPFPASSSFSGKWLYGSTMCQLYAFEGMFLGMVAIGFVVALCIERYVVGSKPNSESSGWFYLSAISINIGNGLFWASMPLLGWGSYAIENTGVSCALNWTEPDEGFVSYIITLETFSFVLPMIVAALCLYWGRTSSPNDQRAGSSGAVQQPQVLINDQNLTELPEDTLKMLCYIFIIFVFVGWGPFALLATMSMIRGYSSSISMLASSIPPLAAKLMVSAYPMAYAIASPRFRNSFCSIFRGAEEKRD